MKHYSDGRLPVDRAPVSRSTERSLTKSLHVPEDTRTPPEVIADAQRGLTHLAKVRGWTVAESAEIWRALGLDRRVP